MIYSAIIIMQTLLQLRNKFATKLSVPIVNVAPFLAGSSSSAEDCKTVADALHKYGCLIIKDPRVKPEQNNAFLDMMEKYFQKRAAQFYAGRPVPDVYPEEHYQVGATPEYLEKAKDHSAVHSKFGLQHKAITNSPVPFDAKWRYFWQVCELEERIKSKQIPKDFPEFKKTMDDWGTHMINGCFTVAEMAGIGLGFQKETFSQMLKGGPHKLAPTGSDLARYKVGTVFAGFHYDFNFLTIHGKARYPGLFAWLRTGEKFSVAVPEGHLLLQAGKQFQWLTGGYINCGFHQVIYTQEVENAKNKAISEGRIPWRVSSTLFSHIREDIIMKPLGKYCNPQSLKKYPEILSMTHTIQELEDISLKKQ